MDVIRVKGYKSFKDLSIKLENINLLIGANVSRDTLNIENWIIE